MNTPTGATELADANIEEVPPQSLYEISLQALSGTMNSSTMRLRGTVQQKPVMVLVDSGSTHSFIDVGFHKRLALPLSDQKPFAVQVANGERMTNQGVCTGVVINCQGKKNYH